MGKRILIAEDHEPTAELIEMALRLDGYETQHVATGIELLEFASSGEFDLILTDVMMPTLHGDDVAELLREQGVTTPTIFITGRPNAIKARGGIVLPKPFTIDELRRAVFDSLRA